jgi:hypothetical protein
VTFLKIYHKLKVNLVESPQRVSHTALATPGMPTLKELKTERTGTMVGITTMSTSRTTRTTIKEEAAETTIIIGAMITIREVIEETTTSISQTIIEVVITTMTKINRK